ncbi:YgiQ family radical SAM protein [Ligaoa zhengdingensis]|uniref:YgiQ family radical SAM protein n=1 Tax=Ligaoa zhengdingensis TaxID=2763658 RepID=UPI0031BB18F4
MPFLPLNQQEMTERGWDGVDFVCVTGDAYVDHPSFGIAIVSRVLEAEGFRVGMIAQPDWRSAKSFNVFGRPRYGYFVTGGNIDSMVAHYTAAKRRRSDDAYTPGGKAGKRPDRATIVYCNKIRELYPDIPIVIGGIEASLRRFAHYDYWDDAVRPSILVDSGADLLIFGMGEHQTAQIARRLAAGEPPSALTDLRGICYTAPMGTAVEDAVSIASFHKVSTDKAAYARATKQQIDEQDEVTGRPIVQKHAENLVVVQTPPAPALTQEELDRVFALPFMRYYHPSYEAQGGVKAIEEVEFSIMHNRGCFGHCNFCSIAYHQGRRVTCRSRESVLAEAKAFTQNPHFKGYIHDVGGPTANFRLPSCKKQEKLGLCKDRKCLAPSPCPALQVDHSDYLELLRELRALPGVKQVFIRSGIRFDYLMADQNDAFLRELIAHHVSGQLKVAPEHCSAQVLDRMGKPHIEAYNRFQEQFYRITRRIGKEQYLVPYLMSSHPGSTLKDAVQLALFLKKNNIRPEQVQDFYPTPATLSTCMFYTGLDPYTMKPVYVPKTSEEKAMQRALLQYFKPENRRLVKMALLKAGRADLIGSGKECLIPADRDFIEKHKQAALRQGGDASWRGRGVRAQGAGKKPSRYAKGKPKQKPKKG